MKLPPHPMTLPLYGKAVGCDRRGRGLLPPRIFSSGPIFIWRGSRRYAAGAPPPWAGCRTGQAAVATARRRSSEPGAALAYRRRGEPPRQPGAPSAGWPAPSRYRPATRGGKARGIISDAVLHAVNDNTPSVQMVEINHCLRRCNSSYNAPLFLQGGGGV